MTLVRFLLNVIVDREDGAYDTMMFKDFKRTMALVRFHVHFSGVHSYNLADTMLLEIVQSCVRSF